MSRMSLCGIMRLCSEQSRNAVDSSRKLHTENSQLQQATKEAIICGDRKSVV